MNYFYIFVKINPKNYAISLWFCEGKSFRMKFFRERRLQKICYFREDSMCSTHSIIGPFNYIVFKSFAHFNKNFDCISISFTRQSEFSFKRPYHSSLGERWMTFEPRFEFRITIVSLKLKILLFEQASLPVSSSWIPNIGIRFFNSVK